MGGQGVAGAQVMRVEVSSGARQIQMLVAFWASWRERGCLPLGSLGSSASIGVVGHVWKAGGWEIKNPFD